MKVVLGDDCISRQAVIDMTGLSEWFDSSDSYNEFVIALSELPSVTPQKPTNNYLANGCIDKWEDVDGKKVEAWIVKGKMQIRHRGSIHNFSLPSVTPQEPRKGHWLRMSDLSEQEDDRYKCSRCGNVIHHKNEMDLYTFNSWCGRCGSDNGRHINYEVEE